VRTRLPAHLSNHGIEVRSEKEGTMTGLLVVTTILFLAQFVAGGSAPVVP
jgi:hypothetical protein